MEAEFHAAQRWCGPEELQAVWKDRRAQAVTFLMHQLRDAHAPGVLRRQAWRTLRAALTPYPGSLLDLSLIHICGEEVFKDCASLSGGELARLRFAELALERPNLMFLDEPTNHLDIYMRESLTQALAAYTGTPVSYTHLDVYKRQVLIMLFVRKMPLTERAAWTLVLGGGVGNLIDRVLNGVVVDYINVLFMRFAIFNFADI